ncbi:MAG TPA: hypothetical protein VFP69_18145 [Streptomyces sp.]|nr:hypothetical protein [Streptomyces sp.]
MTGSTPPWKRRFTERDIPGEADRGPRGPIGARDDERGPTTTGAAASLEQPAGDRDDGPAPPATPDPATPDPAAPDTGRQPALRRWAAIRSGAGAGARRSSGVARAGLTHLADRIIDIAPRVPVRDLAALRRQFPGLGPEQIADRLVSGAVKASATVGAGVGAAAMLPVPPAMPAELAAEITGVAAIELKLIAELHEVYGRRPPGALGQRSTAYLNSWSGERGIDVRKPSTLSATLNGPMKQQLRHQIMKRLVRDLPNLLPFMVGAAVGAAVNRRDTRKLAARIRNDLREHQVPWDALGGLPALRTPPDALDMTKGPGYPGP